jgi:ABC-2 type transport system permease protein
MEGQSLYQLLRAPVSQLMSSVQVGRMSMEVAGDPAEQSPALELAWKKWEENNAQSVVRLEQAAAQESESWFGDNPYNQASPGILVQFAIMGMVTSAQVLVQERKNRTLQRLMTTAMRPWEILAGHMLAMFALVFVQSVTLVLFGQWILKVDYLRELPGTLMVLAALGLWVASMSLLIGVMAKSDDQVVLYSMIAMFVFSALGGAWFRWIRPEGSSQRSGSCSHPPGPCGDCKTSCCAGWGWPRSGSRPGHWRHTRSGSWCWRWEGSGL